MNRKLAREECYKMIFSWLFTAEKDCASIEELSANDTLDNRDMEYIERTFVNATAHYQEITELVAKYSKGFSIERIFKPDLSVMLLCIAEMKYDESIPLKVSINEAIDIVKRYSMQKSNSFVNGVLASVYRELTQERVAEPIADNVAEPIIEDNVAEPAVANESVASVTVVEDTTIESIPNNTVAEASEEPIADNN